MGTEISEIEGEKPGSVVGDFVKVVTAIGVLLFLVLCTVVIFPIFLFSVLQMFLRIVIGCFQRVLGKVSNN